MVFRLLHYIRAGNIPQSPMPHVRAERADVKQCSRLIHKNLPLFSQFYLHTAWVLCEEHVWRGSTFTDLIRICQAENYHLLGNPHSALKTDHSSWIFPGNKLLIKGTWYLLNLLIHHFMQRLRPPHFFSLCHHLPLPTSSCFSFFLICLSLETFFGAI